MIDLKELTADQTKAIEALVMEFTKLNTPVNSGGLFNVNKIVQAVENKRKQIDELKIHNAQFQKLKLDVMKKDCEKLNVDLNKLGLNATFGQNGIGIRVLNVESNALFIIWYNMSLHNTEFGNRANGFYIEFSIERGRDFRAKTIEDCIPHLEQKLIYLYEKYVHKV